LIYLSKLEVVHYDEDMKDARIFAKRISPDDYEILRKYWKNKSFTIIAFILRRYGLEFKGLTHLETMVKELFDMKGQKNRTQAKE